MNREQRRKEVKKLIKQGYKEQVAKLIVKNMDEKIKQAQNRRDNVQ